MSSPRRCSHLLLLAVEIVRCLGLSYFAMSMFDVSSSVASARLFRLFSCVLMVLQGFRPAVYVSIAIASAHSGSPKVLELAFSLSLFVKTWIRLYFIISI